MFHASDRVLVAIMNNPRDFEIARDEGWYRIPAKRAPQSTTEAAALPKAMDGQPRKQELS